jgi:tripeptide aminopeptidase
MIDVERLKGRFFKYVKIYSQSEDGVEDRFPSTPQQLEFAKILRDDLEEMGLEDVDLDEHGYVMATLPATQGAEDKPVIGFLAHYDTYHGVSGKDIEPRVHVYDGGQITFPNDPELVLDPEDNPELKDFVGQEVITASGQTLLSADDKAGLAEILEAVAWMMENPDHPRPKIRLGFTPDEEVGNGTAYFDVKKFGAHCAYTIDGTVMGGVENETFSADGATIKITGHDVHPGYAKNKMQNAVRIASRFIESIPQGLAPERSEGREGFLHPLSVEANTSSAKISYIVRDFTVEGLERLEAYLKLLAEGLEREFPGAKVEVEIKEQYRNMIYHLEEEPRAVEFALEAVRAAGLEPNLHSIRGGTDGSRLSAMGLPTPNIFAGGMNIHSRKEWVAVPAMEKAAETVVQLAKIWAERG